MYNDRGGRMTVTLDKLDDLDGGLAAERFVARAAGCAVPRRR